MSITANGMICGRPADPDALPVEEVLEEVLDLPPTSRAPARCRGPSDPKKASGRLCIRAMTTAANAAEDQERELLDREAALRAEQHAGEHRPASCRSSTTRPTRTTVLMPTVRAMAGASTVARIDSPNGVARSSNVRSTADEDRGDDHRDVVRVDAHPEHLVLVGRVEDRARELEALVPPVDQARRAVAARPRARSSTPAAPTVVPRRAAGTARPTAARPSSGEIDEDRDASGDAVGSTRGRRVSS